MEKSAKYLTIKYAFLQSAYWISACVFYSFAVVFLHYKNFNNTQIGLILSLSSVISIILQPLIAAFADKSIKITLRYIVIALMVIVFILALILCIIPNSLLLIAGIYTLINAIQFTLIPLLNSLAFEYLNRGVPMNYGLARGIGSVAYGVASYFVGIFVHRFGAGIIVYVFLVSYCFLIISALTFKVKIPLNASVISSISTEKSNYGKPSGNTNEKYSTNASVSILGFFKKYKKFLFLLIGVALIFYSHNMINTYLINIIENVGGNSADMGLALTISAALELPAMAAFIFIVKKINCNTLLKVSAFFFLIKIAIAWLAPNVFILYLSQTFQLLSFALYTPASVYYVNSITEEQDKVKGQSMLGVASVGIAGTVANLTGGRLLDTIGVSDMLLLGTIVSMIGFIVICFSVRKAKFNDAKDNVI